jgi:hypothetical protein
MEKFSMTMGITFMDRITFSVMTLAQVVGSPNPQPGPFE